MELRRTVKEHFSEQLEELRRHLILMGGEVERQIHRAIEALTEMDAEKAASVIAADEDIDRLEMQVEESAIALLALQQPVAVDLRFLVAALKINSDLERIGDHAVNIAGGRRAAGGAEALQALHRHPLHGRGRRVDAQAVARRLRQPRRRARQEGDQEGRHPRREERLDHPRALTYMAEYPTLITYCLELISISKNLERVGDLATNICEDTIFIAEARWVKHHASELTVGD